jgi:hypothetical protein
MVERAIRDSVIIHGAGHETEVSPGPARESGAGHETEFSPGNAREGGAGSALSGTPGIHGTGTFRILPPMTAFLALVNHIYKHEIKGEFQLRLWTDIYLLLHRYGAQILTTRLPAAVEEAGIRRQTATVLTIMKQVWGVELPDGITADSSAAGELTVTRFMDRLAHPGSVESLSQREMFRRNLNALKTLRKKFIFILGDIFPSVEFMKRRYGCRTKAAAFLFYPHRLGKIPWILGLLRTEKYDN